MKKILSLLPLIVFISIIVLFQSCKKDEDPVTPPIERPVYEGSGTVGSEGAIVQVTTQSSPIKGAYVDIPEGALTSDAIVKISLGNIETNVLDDSTVIVIKLEPSGLKFNKPVLLRLPYNNVTNTNLLKAYYYSPDSNYIEQIPINSVDASNKLATFEITHFSQVFIDDDGAVASVNMYYSSGKIGANIAIDEIRSGVNYGLSGIKTLAWSWPLGVFNARQVINYGEFFLSGNAPCGVLQVTLTKTVPNWFDDEIETKTLTFHRTGSYGQMGGELLLSIDGSTPQKIFSIPIQNNEERENWFSGDPLLFKFAHTPDPNKEYYIKAKWAITGCASFDILCGIATKVYSFNNKEFRQKPTQMISSNLDQNSNNIIDTYESSGGVPPQIPILSSPSNGAVNVNNPPTLSWDLSGNATNYALQVSTYFSFYPTVYDEDVGNILSKQISGLNNLTKYYWRVRAKNNNGESYWSDVWNFTTSNVSVNQPPAQPSNPVPSLNAINQSINVDISWQCSDPENDPLTYFIYFGTETNPPLVYANYFSTTFDPGVLSNSTDYYWKIVAKDNHSNSTTGTVWKFSTIAATVNQPPLQPSSPVPSLNAINQSINVDISWTCSDPENDPLTYDIYFGTATNPPLVKSNHTTTTYDPGTLSNNTEYNWKIVAKDNHSNSTTGTVWKFSTGIQLNIGWFSHPTGFLNIRLNDIKAVSDQIVIAVGEDDNSYPDDGRIIKSTDGGLSWTLKFNSRRGFNAVDFVNNTIGWAVNYGGDILKTIDGGETWVHIYSEGGQLYSVDFIDEQRGWVAGVHRILHTTDGGSTWIQQYFTTDDMAFNEVEFFDSQNGIAVGSNGAIMKTTNSGTNWFESSSGTTEVLSDIAFVDNNTIWVTGSSDLGWVGFVIKSTDGGINWSTVTVGTSWGFSSVRFINNQIGWITGSGIFKTIDGGLSWYQQGTDIEFNYYVSSFSFYNDQIGWANVGSIILKTTTAGD